MRTWTLCLVLLAGCESSTATTTAGGDSAVVSDGSASPVDGGGFCCTPSASPACCMSFGGWAASADQCGGQACDGFPLPTMITKDLHGCDVWTGGSGPVCGQPISPDSGSDGGQCSPGAMCTPGQTCSVACGLLCLCDLMGQYACGELPCEGGAPPGDGGAEAGSSDAGIVDGGTG